MNRSAFGQFSNSDEDKLKIGCGVGKVLYNIWSCGHAVMRSEGLMSEGLMSEGLKV